MTIPTLTGMNTALSGLEAYQAGIDTTGENISNANTAGYTRQTVNLGESSPETISSNGRQIQVGAGVSIDDISRERDAYLDTEYRTQNAGSSYWSQMSGQLGQVQTALGDSSTTGVGAALSSLWTAFNDMAQSNTAASQTAVSGAANTLISTLQSVQTQIATVQGQAATQLASLTAAPTATQPAGGEVYQDAQQIASLNTQIEQETQAGISPNTLLDARDQVLDQLSSLGTVSTADDPNNPGGISVSFAGQSTPLVAADDTVTLPATGSYSASSGGQLGALAELASGTTLSGLTSQLDGVAQNVASTVNGALGDTAFSYDSSTGALTFNASALSTVTTAQASAAAGLSGGTADQAYASFVDQVGTTAQNATNQATTTQALTGAVQTQRESVSGVSLDEEMSNLISYQQGYEASAKAMSTMNDMIQTLISTVGGAGL